MECTGHPSTCPSTHERRLMNMLERVRKAKQMFGGTCYAYSRDSEGNTECHIVFFMLETEDDNVYQSKLDLLEALEMCGNTTHLQ
jgi:hypothetical protein